MAVGFPRAHKAEVWDVLIQGIARGRAQAAQVLSIPGHREKAPSSPCVRLLFHLLWALVSPHHSQPDMAVGQVGAWQRAGLSPASPSAWSPSLPANTSYPPPTL